MKKSRSRRASSSADIPLARTGVSGLDEVLRGGLPANHLYLIDGEPGTGKTTLALQFLREGVEEGERGLYVALSESADELRTVATSHGWDLEGIDIFEMSAGVGGSEDDYTIFHPAEIELQQAVASVYAAVDEHKPRRIAFDSLSEMRLLARDPLRFRRQVLSLKRFFEGRDCTVLLLDDKAAPDQDLQLHSIAHGVIALEHLALEYGAERRRLQVKKVRGHRFRGGFHDFRIQKGGINVFPRINNQPGKEKARLELHLSGSSELDDLLGGGVVRGTSMLITGAAGTGKSILATQYAEAIVKAGGRVRFYIFDERLSTFHLRARGLKMDIFDAMESGALNVHQVEPTALSPGEFAQHVQRAVEDDEVEMIAIDSINGYMQSMPEERLLPLQLHELLTYMSNKGVTTILTLVQRGMFGRPVDEAADVSYLADTVILLRYFEFNGAVRQAISVVKKRSGNHERTIREVKVGAGGLTVGEPLHEFQGVLTGVPEYVGEPQPLMSYNAAGIAPPSRKSRPR
ncbi:MAG TPA: ATPase domain-containing protein [Gemmatimonadaceae bacterium]|nr:ATPase domain-containing protein [Gemmatimonadaceae bacterium]